MVFSAVQEKSTIKKITNRDKIMNRYTRNTVLYSFLTISLVVSYWIVRQGSDQPESVVSNDLMIELNEQDSSRLELGSKPTVLVSQYSH